MFLPTWTAVLAFSLLQPALGAIYTDPSQLPSSNKYDYIVIGAGVGGGVIASRLSENSCAKVLVIEAGPSDIGIESLQIPFLCVGLAPNTPLDWNYTSIPQPGLNGRSIPYPRGRVVGGSSSINYMIWNTGTVDDFNRLSQVTKDPGWSWERVQPLIKKIEKLTPPADHHDTTGQIDPSIHGTSGPVGISLQGFPSLLDERVFETTSSLPSEFPFNKDMNSGSPLGIGHHPVFLGVQFASSSSGPLYALNATQEVIVAAGAIATPQLLQLSGIGDPALLKQNLQDHTVLPNVWSINANFTPDDFAQHAHGQFATPPATQIGWFRLPKDSPIFKTEHDPTGGPTSPHYEFIFAVRSIDSFVEPTPTTGHFMIISTNLFSPSSRMWFRDSEICQSFRFPHNRPGIAQLQASQRFLAASPAVGNFAGVKTDDQISEYARNNAATVFHPAGTAFMSSHGAKNGVLNPDLTVKNTIGLRIVDASVFPFIPSMHPQGYVYIIAERAASVIQGTGQYKSILNGVCKSSN
ncbi:hypothetical protein B0F90DRAFT_1732646 [Multifurca ochricompacta]|uniref:Glucose-methanol-choline oxidoreductase N-terminal domain-containing protein n=1 Tax=Multifurca ochricompacta TaxID=376703 RepID=A0AAD4M1J7_9AGAM|nr:hypothetical protein B0F90DRAFT_1732646 [Multifurca ochricompacta]